ncbi:MAG: nuclear transport factor 2 family protein [bacterium]
MTRTTLAAALLSFSSIALSRPAECQAARMAEQRIERDVRRASDDEVRALLVNDVKALTQLWSDDFVVTNPLNQLVHKQQVLALITSDTLAFTSYDRQIEYVHAYGGVVVVAGSESVVWAGRMPMAGKRTPLRFTALWMKRGGRWREVARHANVISSTRS